MNSPELQPSFDQRPPSHYPPAQQQAWRDPGSALFKNPFVAGMLAIFPGLGNIYNGLYMRGVAFFVAFASCIAMLDNDGGPVFGMALAFTYIFNIVDSVRQATLINLGLAGDPAANYKPTPLNAGGGTALAGILLFAVGAISMADEWFEIDLSWLRDAWPLVPMSVGAWLLFSAWRDRKPAAAPPSEEL